MKQQYTDEEISSDYNLWEEISSDYNLWEEYADPHGTMSKEEFDALTIAEKVSMLNEMF